VSDSLNEFALKVASALDTYASKGEEVSLNGVPFHFAMVKMAQRLKQRQAKDAVKTAFFPGMAAGLLTAAGLSSLAKRVAPHLTDFARPKDLLRRGIAGIAPEGMSALGRAIEGTPLEALVQKGIAEGQGAAMKPWHLGLAGAGGLAAGQFLNRDRGNSGPPMIIA